MTVEKGAEAEVNIGKTVTKTRLKKEYRNPLLDDKLRSERNRKEARILQKAAGKVNVPRVIEAGKFSISMEKVNGQKIRNMRSISGLEEKIGGAVGALHSLGFFHGDLTTSNMILDGEKVFLIDFGLSDRGKTEDFATDIKVFLEAARATHGEFSEEFFFRGYSSAMPKSREVLERLEKVYERGRYKTRPKSSQ
jgi:Kae1-associated kinase Bud32